jgi:segregation and condensation protein B
LLDPRLPKDFEIPEPMITDDVNLDEEDLVSEDENQFFEDFLSES